MTESRIDAIKGSYMRKGKCVVCRCTVQRSKTFSGVTMEDVQKQADHWGDQPLKHKGCE